VDPVEKKLAQYKQKLLNHISKTEDIRNAKQYPDYRQGGRRGQGRKLKRLIDG